MAASLSGRDNDTARRYRAIVLDDSRSAEHVAAVGFPFNARVASGSPRDIRSLRYGAKAAVISGTCFLFAIAGTIATWLGR
jgi:hypothetical protein